MIPDPWNRARPTLSFPASRALLPHRNALPKLLAVLALLGLLAGRGVAQDLTVWTPYRGAALDWLRSEASDFSAAFDVQVTVVPLKLGEIKQGTVAASDKGTGGDVLVGIPQDQFSALADAGLLADLGRYTTEGYLADLSASARSAFRYGGALYGLPLAVQGPALIVNTDLVPSVPTSYQGLLDAAAAVTANGRYGFAFDVGNFYYAYGWLHSWGGAVFGRGVDGELDPKTIELATPGAVAGAEALRSLRFDAGVMPDATDYASVHELFLKGDLAMTYDGPWAIPSIRSAGIPIAVAAMPPTPDGKAWSGFMNVDGVLIDRYSSDPVGAANLAKWLTTADAQVALARRAGMVPASSSALARVADDPVIAGFGAALAAAEPIPNLPAMGEVWGPMDRALAAILASASSDVSAALDRAAQDLAPH